MKALQAIVAVVSCLILFGCATSNQRVAIEYRPISVPDRYLNCDAVKKTELPKADTLTDKQASQLIMLLYKRVNQCSTNMDAIRDYIKSVEAVHGAQGSTQ